MDARVDHRGLAFPPERTALLVIDPANDFLSEGGACWALTSAVVHRHNVLGNLARLLPRVRERGLPARVERAEKYGPRADEVAELYGAHAPTA